MGNSETKSTLCGELGNGALEKFDAGELASLCKKSTLAPLILALALIYNDLKGLITLGQELEKDKPQQSESSFTGELNGLKHQIYRYEIGLVCELIGLLNDYRAELNSPILVQCMKRGVPKDSKDAWDSLLGLVLKDERLGDRSVKKVLAKIRSNGIFHYSPGGILKGFNNKFSKTESAFISRGNSMATTRFYFADASVQSYIRSEFALSPKLEVLVDETIRNINLALRFLVDRFLRISNIKISPVS